LGSRYFENPFSPVEFTKKGFKILKVIDNEYLELAWNEYKWNTDTKEYLRE
jgi:hypothetical protein